MFRVLLLLQQQQQQQQVLLSLMTLNDLLDYFQLLRAFRNPVLRWIE